MKFYRNLGAITFESETSSFQIFTTSSATAVFQIKQPEIPITILEDIVNGLNQHYHCQYFSVYSQPHKGSCILLTNCKNIEFKSIETRQLCTLMMEAAKIIHKSSQIMHQWVGNCSLQQFRMIGDKLGFIYIPLIKEEQTSKVQSKIINQFMGMIRQAINLKDVSQKLLLKKLQKCKFIAQMVEEIGYFSSVYCVGRIQLHQYKKALNFGNISKNYSAKSAKKLSIFKLELPKSRKLQNSFRSDQYSLSQHRQSQSTNAMHISFPSPLKHHNSAHTSQQRTSLNSSAKRDSCSKVSRVSLKNSQVKEEKPDKQRVIKRQSKLKEAAYTPVNSMDEEKLLQKLRTKKNTKLIKAQQIVGVKPVIVAEAIISQDKQQSIGKIEHFPEIEQKKIKSTRQIEYNNCETTKPIQAIKKSIDSIPFKENTPSTKNTSKIASPQNTPPQTSKPNNQISCLKKIVKKKQQEPQDYTDELQVIDLCSKTREKKTVKAIEASIKKGSIPSPQLTATVQNGWNKGKLIGLQQEQTKRDNKALASQNLVNRCRKLNLMGTAVANTKGHLVNYQKIFWQLPLFFLYRGFYIRRLQIEQEAQGLQSSSRQIAEMFAENLKIKDSNEKLIKTIVKKLKKMDHSLLESLQPYLNLNKSVDCEEVMRNFVKEYIDSLSEAVQKDQHLIIHLLEITDAYLIYRGEEIKESKRVSAEKNHQIGSYVREQRKLLKKYI